MPWVLARTDKGEVDIIRDNCTCAEHCKEVARKFRKIDKYSYNHKMAFSIFAPDGRLWGHTQDGCSWRLRWIRNLGNDPLKNKGNYHEIKKH